MELLKIGKVAESKKLEIQTDLQKSISEVSVECENMPIALLSKDRYKVKNPHKQVSIYSARGFKVNPQFIFPVSPND